MMGYGLSCKQEERRRETRATKLNGLDYIEIDHCKGGDGDTCILRVYFLGKAPGQFDGDNDDCFIPNVVIEGGRRIRDFQVVNLKVTQLNDENKDDWMTLTVKPVGDFSTYKLWMVAVDEDQQPKIKRWENGRPIYQPFEGFDPRYACAEFSFKAGCQSDLDCLAPPCAPVPLNEPDINYLAKDYASFRQLILDRMSLLMPDWKERHVPDIGIALAEVLAYVGDHLSYYQDAVATEAYLDTARQRISVKRHARLMDYRMHEGCNARAWVCVETDIELTGDKALKPEKVYFTTGARERSSAGADSRTSSDLDDMTMDSGEEVFEPMGEGLIELRVAHSVILFYTWGDRECCLPKGTRQATLFDGWVYDAGSAIAANTSARQKNTKSKKRFQLDNKKLKRKLHLQPGDVLIFEERIGPKTGQFQDADLARRHAVRLTRVDLSEDPVITTPLIVNGKTCMLPTPVVEIEWGSEDALPFALCLSAMTETDCKYIANISVALGNVILVDHGRTIQPQEQVGRVPVEKLQQQCDCEDHPGNVVLLPGQVDLRLSKTHLTFSQQLPKEELNKPGSMPAQQLTRQDPRQAIAQIKLDAIPPAPGGENALFSWDHLKKSEKLEELAKKLLLLQSGPSNQPQGLSVSEKTRELLQAHKDSETISEDLCQSLLLDLQALLEHWTVKLDILASGPNDRDFVVEIDNEQITHLRFGDDELGKQPAAGMTFYAGYRIGNGLRGNVGADTISRMAFRGKTINGASFGVRNPLPAEGGADAEPLAETKLFAPATFRKKLERAIIADDYARLVQREFGQVQRAIANLTWTGSWYEANVAVDPLGNVELSADAPLLDEITNMLDRYRRIGHDLRIEGAHYVPLDIELTVCVLPDYLRGHVKAALLAVFSNRLLAGGKLGLFHPDNLTFGEGIYLSGLVAAAQAVPGVESVNVTRLQRKFEPSNHEIENGVLPLRVFEVARLDNDPSFPEHGNLALVMMGGR